jgi:hypothetical protein
MIGNLEQAWFWPATPAAEVPASDRPSPEACCQGVGAADLQQFQRPQRDKAEQHRT